MNLPNEQVREIALESGFKLKEQPDGSMDLNPYVYDFAKSVRDASPLFDQPTSFRLIERVPSIRILYSVDLVKAASRIRDALGKLTNNNREKLVIIMGNSLAVDVNMTVCLFESRSEVRVEDVTKLLSPNKMKVFTPESLPTDIAKDIAKYILSLLSQSMIER